MKLLLLVLPLLLLGAAAGALRGLSAHPGLSAPSRRLLKLGWVVTLLCGAPAWLVAAALLGLW